MKLDDLVSGEHTCRCFGLLLARTARTVLVREEFVVSGGSSWSGGVVKGFLVLCFPDPVLRSGVGIKTPCSPCIFLLSSCHVLYVGTASSEEIILFQPPFDS